MIDPMPVAGFSAVRRGRLRLRTVLLLGMLLPVVGVVAIAGVVVDERWAERQDSAELEDESLLLREILEFHATLAEERVLTTALVLAADLGVDPAVIPGFRQAVGDDRLNTLRRRIDAELAADPSPDAARLLADLGALRARLDAGTSSYPDVQAVNLRVRAHFDARWAEQMVRVEEAADRVHLTADVRATLRTLRHSLEAFAEADTRIDATLRLLLRGPDPASAAEVVAASARFAASADSAAPAPGTHAAAAWNRFATDPAAGRIEATVEATAAQALGIDAPDASPAPGGEAIADGIRWAALLAEIVQAAATDVADIAGDEAEADLRVAFAQSGAALLLALVALVLALAAAREVARPARDLEDAPRRIHGGDFDLDPVPTRGPRELGATVEAFNDMAATLAAVQDHAVALAEDPDSPVVAHPLPGRTGRALQVALDRLRSSVRAAEQREVELTELATRDTLTGLLNRGAALDAIARELARAQRDGTTLFALYLDLDGFKALNDAHGHAAGDEGIRRAARALVASTRDADVVARIGGDEFLVVGPVPTEDGPGVDALAERLHGAVTSEAVPVEDADPVPLRCSIGVDLSGAGDTVDGLIRRADVALYRAKQPDHGPVCWYDPAQDSKP